MQLGYFTMPLHPPGRPWGETLREDREAILMCDRLGVDVGETTEDGRVTLQAVECLCACEHAPMKR